jgi:hypothetical protein
LKILKVKGMLLVEKMKYSYEVPDCYTKKEAGKRLHPRSSSLRRFIHGLHEPIGQRSADVLIFSARLGLIQDAEAPQQIRTL